MKEDTELLGKIQQAIQTLVALTNICTIGKPEAGKTRPLRTTKVRKILKSAKKLRDSDGFNRDMAQLERSQRKSLIKVTMEKQEMSGFWLMCTALWIVIMVVTKNCPIYLNQQNKFGLISEEGGSFYECRNSYRQFVPPVLNSQICLRLKRWKRENGLFVTIPSPHCWHKEHSSECEQTDEGGHRVTGQDATNYLDFCGLNQHMYNWET